MWLFSTGPLGADATDAKEWTCARPPSLRRSPDSGRPSAPKTNTSSSGALDPGGLTFAEKTVRKLPAVRAMMPEGDFRDWTEIQVWARSIAEELSQLDAGHVQEDP